MTLLICFAGPLPPPVHGMAAVNATVLARLKARSDVAVIDTSPGGLERNLRYHAVKTGRAIRGIILLLCTGIRGGKRLYASVDDGLGGLWTALFALTARACGMSVVLHHHSYKYVVERRWVTALLVSAAGPNALHVTLDGDMDRRLRELYHSVRHSYVAPNPVSRAALVPPNPRRPGLTIGMLANLTFEKGIEDFVAIVDRLDRAGIVVRGILAGPVSEPHVQTFVANHVARAAGLLVHEGPLSGADKETFFAAIDVFVFPTLYRTEAYPLVLVEALSRGVPVMAPARGAIASLASLRSAKIVAVDENFVDRATAMLADLARSPEAMTEFRLAAAHDGPRLNEENQRRQDALVELLLAPLRI